MFAALEVSYRLLARMKDSFHAHCDCALFLRRALSGFKSLTYRLDASTKLFCRETTLCHLLVTGILSTKMDPVYIGAISGLVLLFAMMLALFAYLCRSEIVDARYHALD